MDHLLPRRFVRGLWDGLVTYGMLCVCGRTDAYEPVRRGVRWEVPPPGHPERLRADLPLTAVERALEHDLTGGARGSGGPR
ncbi:MULTISPECIES: DUF6059 family protein [Streptomyces]|uniref:DUF6059 family protein n=1 Tax=Streptomyces TaxID=1883 RepID=UPI0013B89B1F|nr:MULTISPECIES: DUF6059 family protein [Streptomyces]NEC73302.1 hypothetical protein [Streptomyces rochei]